MSILHKVTCKYFELSLSKLYGEAENCCCCCFLMNLLWTLPLLFLHHVMPGCFFTLTFQAGYEIVYVTIQLLTSAKTFAKYYNWFVRILQRDIWNFREKTKAQKLGVWEQISSRFVIRSCSWVIIERVKPTGDQFSQPLSCRTSVELIIKNLVFEVQSTLSKTDTSGTSTMRPF